MNADEVLDTYGLLCPMPIVETNKKMQSMEKGKVLEVLSTDEGIKEDMPAWCEATGNTYLGVEENDDEFHVFIRKE